MTLFKGMDKILRIIKYFNREKVKGRTKSMIGNALMIWGFALFFIRVVRNSNSNPKWHFKEDSLTANPVKSFSSAEII